MCGAGSEQPAELAPTSPPLLQFALFKPYGNLIAHAVFTRHGGVSSAPFDTLNVSYRVGDLPRRVEANRARCARALGLPLAAITAADLVHGADVGIVERDPAESMPDGSRCILAVDSLISARAGDGLLITAADCLQVMLLDPITPAIGLVHAGWRGLARGAIGAAVAAMAGTYRSRASAMLAAIGPGLGPCCAEFTDPNRELPSSFGAYIRGRHVDLWAAAVDQLVCAGLPPEHVEQLAVCTRCGHDRFFSHRGDGGQTGRFAAIIALRPAAA
jgi:YfiH family protein